MPDERDHADPAHAGRLHHVELNAADLDAAAAFWDWLLGELGYERKDEWDGGRSWVNGPTYVVLGAADGTADEFDRRAPGLDHLAFHAGSRDQVDRLTDAVRERADASLLYEDRHPFAGGYYALYCEAPGGATVEVVAPDA
ncbi:VOC family protein [Halobaculum litoreum]|uniref:VOC family protein n=1 Tax=Halobaculum litoreum TaxID=3031998 RepID=A0ABD5XS05_9EURY|nr:VOC family protein [Halobaculum sp. DT92]